MRTLVYWPGSNTAAWYATYEQARQSTGKIMVPGCKHYEHAAKIAEETNHVH